MTEQEKLAYLADRQTQEKPIEIWAPVLTEQQKPQQEKDIRDYNLPF